MTDQEFHQKSDEALAALASSMDYTIAEVTDDSATNRARDKPDGICTERGHSADQRMAEGVLGARGEPHLTDQFGSDQLIERRIHAHRSQQFCIER